MSEKKSVEKTVREIRHKINKKFLVEENIQFVLEGSRGKTQLPYYDAMKVFTSTHIAGPRNSWK